MAGLGVVAGLQAVGLILVVAMLIVPPVSARFWTDRLWVLVVVAGVIGALSGYFGSVISALLPRKPAGAVIVLVWASAKIFRVGVLMYGKPPSLVGLVHRTQPEEPCTGTHEQGARPEARLHGAAHGSDLEGVQGR